MSTGRNWMWPLTAAIAVVVMLCFGLDSAADELAADGDQSSGAAEAIEPGTIDGTGDGATARAIDRPSESGDSLIFNAHARTKNARTVSDYTEILRFCHEGIRSGVSQETNAYAQRLMSWAFNRRGEMLAEQGHDTVALSDFEAAVQTDKTRWRAFHNRGISYAMLGRFQQAISDFNRTIELNPRFANAYFNRGEVRYELGLYTSAIQDYGRAIKLVPNDATYYNSRGHAYYRLGKFREAVNDYTVAIRIDSNDAEALTNRGDLYADLGYYLKAVRDYKEAVRADPNLARAYQSAAWLMATCPDAKWRSTDGALETAAKAIGLGGENDPRYLDTMAAAQANAGKYDLAEATLKKAIELAAEEDPAHFKARLALYHQHKPYRMTPKPLPSLAADEASSETTQAAFESAVKKPRGR